MITAIIRNRFIFSPPLLSTVIAPFEGLEKLYALVKLVRMFLPEEKASIMGLKPTAAGKLFIEYFSKKYFPINISDQYYNYLEMLTADIPVRTRGFDKDEYEPGWKGLSYSQLLAETVCVNPFGRPEVLPEPGCHIGRLSAPLRRGGNRLTVIDEFEKRIGNAAVILKLIPEGGYRLEEIEKALCPVSPYSGFTTRCQWLFQRTGNIWYDMPRNKEFKWTRQNVDRLARDWTQAREIEKQFNHLDSWLGHDRENRIAEIVRYIHERVPKRLSPSTSLGVARDKSLGIKEVFDHGQKA